MIMIRALRTLVAAAAFCGLTATVTAQEARLNETERERLLPLVERFAAEVSTLNREASRASSPTTRNRFFRNMVAELNNEAAAFRAALLRNRPVDVEAEVQMLRDSLTRVEDRVHARRAPDAALRQAVRGAGTVLDQMEREMASLGPVAGKAPARFEPGRYAEVDDLGQLAAELVEHSARLRERMERGARNAPAAAHFDEQVRQFQRMATRRRADDYRPHLQRLQSDLNAALREIRRAGADETAIAEWEWADGLLERMSEVSRTGAAAAARTVPADLLGLSHELHVQMMKAEELAKAAGRGGDNFARLGDQAYALHHEMHDGRLSYTEAQDRVEAALRTFPRAQNEVGPATPELRAQWAAIQVTLEKMRTLLGV